MTASYTWVGWNRQKLIYDGVVAGGIVLYLGMFIGLGELLFRPPHQISDEILILRALGTCAIVMLHIVLCIGPAARLDRRFLPLLYNRRHLGVATFLVAAGHGAFSLLQYHGFGDINPLLSLLTANTNYFSFTGFPFEILGLLALIILFLMAATSHDFWLRNLTARTWKSLHMLVYGAYALVVMHVALGALQSERSIVYPVLLGAGVVLVGGLHLMAGWVEGVRDARGADAPTRPTELIDVCSIDEIPEKRARTVCLKGRERIAVFRYDGKVSAVSNVCAHQGGPLGEGKIVDGCITCPWHGYQYLPANGQSPPPFTDKVHTYRVTLRARRVLLDPNPLPKGTAVEPASFEEAPQVSQNGSPTPCASPPPAPAPLDTDEFYIGYLARAPRRLSRHTIIVAGAHILFAAACATVGVAFLSDPGPAVWEYGRFRDFEGLLRARPYPVIELSEPVGGPGGARSALVVDFGKHGARAKAAPFDEHPVRITGSLLERDGRILIELAPQDDPIAHLNKPFDQISPNPVPLGAVTLRGEIVDPKCFLGAMKPGEGKTHKACAVRCISGGIPPVLLTWDGRGGSTYYVLTGPDGGAINQEILPLVGEPVEVKGELKRRGDMLFLAIDPSAVVRP